MMKNRLRIQWMALAAASLALGMLAVPGNAEYISAAETSEVRLMETEAEQGVCGKNCTWSLKDGVLTIAGSGNMYNYRFHPDNPNKCLDTPWNEEKITAVIICDGVTSVGSLAFSGSKNLKTVTLASSVKRIGYSAFKECENLESIIFPEKLQKIGSGAFWRCKKIKEVRIPAAVRNIEGYVFSYCESLERIVVDSSNPVYDSRKNCNAIIEKKSGTLISGCNNTVIPEGITCIADLAFSGMKDLVEMVVPSGITEIGNGAFECCSNLEKVEVPISVTQIGSWVFDLDDKLTVYCKKNSYMEEECKRYSIKYVAADIKVKKGLTFDDPVTWGIYKVTSTKKRTVTYIRPSYLETQEAEVGATIEINYKKYKVTAIAAKAFQKANRVRDILIGKNVKSIGKAAFSPCKSLEDLTIKSSSIRKVGKKAFRIKSTAKKLTVRIVKKNAAHTKKLLKKYGLPQKAVVKKVSSKYRPKIFSIG